MHKYVKNLQFEDLILFENDHFILINKPPYLSTLEDRNDPINVLSLARSYHEEAQVCHRLDKETSGLIAISKHFEAYRYFSMMLEDREVKKVYHAVCHGIQYFDNLEADQPIATGSNKSTIDFRSGKPSLTLITKLEQFQKHTLVKCFPVTGRLHQIRVHLAFHKAPIVSDPSYGGATVFLSDVKRKFHMKKGEEEQPLIPRVGLHASQLAFRDFDDESKIIEVEAPYPKDFDVLIKQLRKNT